MAYKQREKKRRAKKAEAAMRAAQLTARAERSASDRWWLTITKRDTCCATCAGMLRIGRPMLYRASPREALCEPCGQARGLSPRPSTAWVREAHRRRVTR